jgi:hypothetical protein
LEPTLKTVAIRNRQALANWRTRIESAWQKSVASVIEVGKLIKQAKQELGVSYNLLETELPFSSTVASFLVKIAEHPVLSNPAYYSKLPNSYNTLYHLTSVDEKQLVEQIESGEISPNYTLASAKYLRIASPINRAGTQKATKETKEATYEVGTIAIGETKHFAQFQADLAELLERYKGAVTFTHRQNSLAEWHRQYIHQLALAKIEKAESELKDISLENIRMLEDAAHFLQKDKNQKNKREVVINNELVERTCLPDDYKDFKKLVKLLGREEISRGFLKKWCIENKVPNQFTELKSMDKDLYVWEQVRLITENKDVKGATKRLKDLASRSTIPKIKRHAQEALEEVTRFDKKA